MRSLLVVIVGVLCATPVFAQVFPRIEKDGVQKRIAGVPTEKEPENGGNDPTPDAVEGEAVLKRYNELLAGFVAGKKDQLKASTRWTDQAHESVRKYLEARAQLRLGFYEDAAKTYDSVGFAVKKEGEIKTQELRNLVKEIKDGKAFYFRMIAVVMQEYTNFKDEAELEAAWLRAMKEADKVRKELQTAVDRRKVDEVGGPLVIREMTGWQVAGKNYWRTLWTAERNVIEKPDNMNSWVALVNASGPRDMKGAEDQTPHFLKRRAAAMVIRQFWQTAPYVKGAFADISLASSHLGVYQCDDYGQYLQPQEYHSLAGKGLVGEVRKQADAILDIIKGLRNE